MNALPLPSRLAGCGMEMVRPSARSRSPNPARLDGLALGLLIALASTGCQSEPKEKWSNTGPSGSISDINRKLGNQHTNPGAGAASTAVPVIVLLVVHNAEGKPEYIEVQRSSGDPATDRRAQDYVMKERRFPKGTANTVTVTVDPRRLPKP